MKRLLAVIVIVTGIAGFFLSTGIAGIATKNSDGSYTISQEDYDRLWAELYSWEYRGAYNYYYGDEYGNQSKVWYKRAYRDNYGHTWSKLNRDARAQYFNKFWPHINEWDIYHAVKAEWDSKAWAREYEQKREEENVRQAAMDPM